MMYLNVCLFLYRNFIIICVGIAGCYASWCWCCFLGTLAEKIDESWWSCCFVPYALAMYRMKVRSVLRIQVSHIYYILYDKFKIIIFISYRVILAAIIVRYSGVHFVLVFKCAMNLNFVVLTKMI